MAVTGWITALKNRFKKRNHPAFPQGKPRPRFRPELARLEDRCVMSSSGLMGPMVAETRWEMPPATVSEANRNTVVWLGDDKSTKLYGDFPLKTLTITNNWSQTIYPILRGPNDGVAYRDPNFPERTFTGSLYDAADPRNEEYRGYIGYTDLTANKNYLGVPAGKAVTIQVPLAFWDGGRMFISTDGKYLTNKLQVKESTTQPNPFNYFDREIDGKFTKRYIQPQDKALNPGVETVVMWYHGAPQADAKGNLNPLAPAPAVPAALTEFTFRDTYQFKFNPALTTKFTMNLVNFDVSNVDSMIVPVAMSAPNVLGPDLKNPVPAPNDFAWTGAAQNVTEFQEQIRIFTSDGAANGLGTYFDPLGNGGQSANKGWSRYFFPPELQANSGILIPSGAVVIGSTPFGDHRSPFNNNRFELTTGGNGIVQTSANAGSVGTDPPNVITLNPLIQPGAKEKLIQDLKDMQASIKGGARWIVYQNSKLDSGNYVKSVDPDNLKVTLENIPAVKVNASYDFFMQPTDYISTTLANLWYAWADYYQKLVSAVPATQFQGTIPPTGGNNNKNADGYRLNFKNKVDASKLVIGMPVDGPGMPKERQATIMEIHYTDSTNKWIDWVKLSKLTDTGGTGPYNFGAVGKIRRDDRAGSPFKITELKLDFSGSSAAGLDFARKFGAVLYSVMNSMGTIPNNAANKNPYPLQLLLNVIGYNAGFVPFIGTDASYTTKDNRIAAELRDRLKSLLRGVPDFTNDANYPQSIWYPSPATPGDPDIYGKATIQGKAATFGVYNLDPFVWFVHQKLGLSSYGFSVDDDAGNVEATRGTSLKVTVGGFTNAQGVLNPGMSNLAQYTPGAPYGPQNTQTPTPAKTAQLVQIKDVNYKGRLGIANLDTAVYLRLRNESLAEGALGALVSGPGIKPGTRVSLLAGSIDGYTNVVLINQDPKGFKPQSGVYSFYGPVTGVNGQVKSGNQKSSVFITLDKYVIDLLSTMAPGSVNGKFPGTLRITGEGVPPKTTILAIDRVNNQVKLSNALSSKLPAGTYRYTFF